MLDRSACGIPVVEESGEPFIGERMAAQLPENLRRQGAAVSSDEHAFDDVHWVAKRCGKDLGVEAIIVVDLPDLADQLHALTGDVVEAAHERRDECRACFRSEKRLGDGEAQGHVDHVAFVAEDLDAVESRTVGHAITLTADGAGNVRAVAVAENIEVEDDELEGEYARLAMQYGQKAKEIRRVYEQNDMVGDLLVSIRKAKAYDAVVHACSFVDENGQAMDRDELVGGPHDQDEADSAEVSASGDDTDSDVTDEADADPTSSDDNGEDED